jgi:Rieske [2Fe-2S] domain
MAFARNHWCVVASAAEIGGQPLARTVCGDDLVMWRSSAGTASALADRCSHRRYPLRDDPLATVGPWVVAAEPGAVEVDIESDRGGRAARRALAALVTDEAGLASVAAP